MWELNDDLLKATTLKKNFVTTENKRCKLRRKQRGLKSRALLDVSHAIQGKIKNNK